MPGPGTQWGVSECRGTHEGLPSGHRAAWWQVQDLGGGGWHLGRQLHTLTETSGASVSSPPW